MINDRLEYQLNQEARALLRIHCLSIGSQTLRKIKDKFHSYLKALKASPTELRLIGLTDRQIHDYCQMRQDDLGYERRLETMNQIGARIILPESPDYPALLNNMSDQPAVLYVRGELRTNPSVSIVGTRRPTSYGKQVALECATEASRLDLTLVSGLAYGIDSIVHTVAVNNKAHTVAVLPSGIETIAPAGHRALARSILAGGGALISEFPLFTPSLPAHFIIRNRIIAAISSVTIIVEGNVRSGALATAKFANDYTRNLMAVPGDIYSPFSEGPNSLIYNHMAEPLIAMNQIADAYGLKPNSQIVKLNLEAVEKIIINTISRSGTKIDEIIELSKLDIATVSSKVILLELQGLIRHEGAGVYRRII